MAGMVGTTCCCGEGQQPNILPLRLIVPRCAFASLPHPRPHNLPSRLRGFIGKYMQQIQKQQQLQQQPQQLQGHFAISLKKVAAHVAQAHLAFSNWRQ